MRKKHRGQRSKKGEPISEERLEYINQAYARARARKLRRTIPLLVLLIVVVLFATGLMGSSVALVKDYVDTTRIALTPGPGWPQQTGVMEPTQVEAMTGSFVELGNDSCVVYSRTGSRLNAIQSGYARPALAAGKTRFVLYNRSGNELRVESRTQNLYTKTLEDNIFLCAISDNGTLAVVTDDVSSMAKLQIYSPSMEQVLSWNMTANDGTPLRMAFSPDSRRVAAASVTVNGGQMQTNLYVVSLAQGEPVNVGSRTSVPQWVDWLSNDTLLAVYDDCAVLYNANGGEQASYDFNGRTLRGVSKDSGGNVALLLASGQVCGLVTLDKNLGVQYDGDATTANAVVRAGNMVYLLTDSTVECETAAGEFQWSQSLSSRPQALLTDAKQILVFCDNTVQQVTPPSDADSAG